MSKEMLELADKLAARLHGRCVTIGPGLREEVEAAVIALRASAVAEPVAPEAAPTREETIEQPLTANFTKSLPGGALDDSAYEQIEDALDAIDAPMTDT